MCENSFNLSSHNHSCVHKVPIYIVAEISDLNVTIEETLADYQSNLAIYPIVVTIVPSEPQMLTSERL